MTGWIAAYGQYQQEVPGDNFSLEGALELFKKSESPKQFERMLNDPASHVNNLDLNADGYIDYIRVMDLYEDNVHVFVMQSVISDNESQDIAVITLEKRANGKAVLQITGDEDIFGVETIIEPTENVYTYAGQRSSRVVVNVWAWPIVRYVYNPYYYVYVSPWRWGYRPNWWHPWRPVVYHDYYTYWRPYRRHYSMCYTNRIVYAQSIYRPHRTTSVIVYNHNHNHIVTYRSTHINKSGYYKHNDRSEGRNINTSVRYNADGRINSRSNRSSNPRNTQRSYIDNSRRSTNTSGRYSSSAKPSSASKVRSKSYFGYNSSVRRNTAATYGAGTSNRRSYQKPNTPDRINRSNATVKSGTGRSYSNYSGSSSASTSVPKMNRTPQQPSGRSAIKNTPSRSSNNSRVMRSSGRSSFQRSAGRSSGNSIQRSSGSSNLRRSSNSPTVRKSGGSSNVSRSRGTTNKANFNRSSKTSVSRSSSSNRGRH